MFLGVAGGIILLVALFLKLSVFQVHQAEGIVIERLGEYHRILNSGLNFIVPFVDQPRAFVWKRTFIDANGIVRTEESSKIRIDLRESIFNFTRYRVFTKDTVELEVNSLMYYTIQDINKAVYEVDDLAGAIDAFAQTQLKDVFGSMTFSQAIQAQEQINDHMKMNMGQKFEKWGLSTQRLEILDIKPIGGVATEMQKQMVAERQRRSDFIMAEGSKAAMRIKSEGDKMRSLNLGIAEQDATRKQSEGTSGAKIELARAERQSIELVAEALNSSNSTQTEYMLAQRYIDVFRTMSGQAKEQVMYLPYEISLMSGIVNKLPSVFGPSVVAPKVTKALSKPALLPAAKSTGNVDEFADLS